MTIWQIFAQPWRFWPNLEKIIRSMKFLFMKFSVHKIFVQPGHLQLSFTVSKNFSNHDGFEKNYIFQEKIHGCEKPYELKIWYIFINHDIKEKKRHGWSNREISDNLTNFSPTMTFLTKFLPCLSVCLFVCHRRWIKRES